MGQGVGDSMDDYEYGGYLCIAHPMFGDLNIDTAAFRAATAASRLQVRIGGESDE